MYLDKFKLFFAYNCRKFSLSRVNKTEWNLNQLPKRHQKMLTKYRQHLNTLRDCIDKNQEVISEMLSENPLRDTSMVSSRKLDEHAAKIRHIDVENVSLTSFFFNRIMFS